jgi:hypothetical protein
MLPSGYRRTGPLLVSVAGSYGAPPGNTTWGTICSAQVGQAKFQDRGCDLSMSREGGRHRLCPQLVYRELQTDYGGHLHGAFLVPEVVVPRSHDHVRPHPGSIENHDRQDNQESAIGGQFRPQGLTGEWGNVNYGCRATVTGHIPALTHWGSRLPFLTQSTNSLHKSQIRSLAIFLSQSNPAMLRLCFKITVQSAERGYVIGSAGSF